MKTFQTIHENIASDLRRKIIQGVIQAGTRIPIQQVAKYYGVSQMPAREAIKKLESEGFLTVYPYRGAVVKELSLAEVEEIFSIRQILESAAGQLALLNLRAKEFVELENLLEKMEKTDDITTWLKFNWQFHETIYSKCGLPRLFKMIRDLRNDINRYLVTSMQVPGEKKGAQLEHRKIMEALKAKNKKQVDFTLRKHLEETCKLLVRVLKERGSTAEGSENETRHFRNQIPARKSETPWSPH